MLAKSNGKRYEPCKHGKLAWNWCDACGSEGGRKSWWKQHRRRVWWERLSAS